MRQVMRMRIKSDETLSEQSLRFIFLGLMVIFSSDELRNTAKILLRTDSDTVKTVLMLFGISLVAVGVAFQYLRKVNRQNIERIMQEGYRMQVKVVGYDKTGIILPKHRIAVTYAFSATDSDEVFYSCKTHESISHRFPLGTQLDMYADPNDEKYYYIDLKGADKEPTMKELRKKMKDQP